MGEPKRVLVAFATAEREFLWPLELEAQATIGEALSLCRARLGERVDGIEIPWEHAAVGIFGELRPRSAPCADGDRIELYRPLAQDPRERRRARLARTRRG